MLIQHLSRILADYPGFSSDWLYREVDIPLSSEKFGTILHVVVCDSQGHPLYDQPVWAEPIGAIIVPVDETGRIGLIESFRGAPPALGDVSIYPPASLEKHGRVSLELPRGFPEPGETPEETARRETEEEIGCLVQEVILMGENNTNTTFFLNNIPIWLAHVVQEKGSSQSPDPLEPIENVRFLTIEEVMKLVKSGEIVCGVTKAALLHYLAWL